MLIAIGFPIALVIAWAFEATPEGIKRTEVADAMPAATSRNKKHAWMYVVVIAGVFSMGLFFLGRYTARDATPRPSEAATASQKSIAVLPFDNLSRDPDNAYFAEGVQDEILTRLAKVADLKVISRGFEERDGSNICWINVDPLLDSLHGDPRFEALVQKVVAPKSEAKQ